MNAPQHGGPDDGPFIAHDFSTNANPSGPPPALMKAVQEADRQRYPDPQYTELRHRLGAAHGVEAARILPTAGGAEAIRRLTLLAFLQGLREVWVPQPGFGDYALAAKALGMEVRPYVDTPAPTSRALIWICNPCNPSGAGSKSMPPFPGCLLVVDRACEPLRLHGATSAAPAGCWELHCPNKALGLTGVRAAYLIAPTRDEAMVASSLAASWVLSAEGLAMLMHGHDEDTQAWIAESRAQLRIWSAAQREVLAELGWEQGESCTNFWLAKPNRPLPDLRAAGIKLRDAASFGLPGWVRIAALPPASQQALMKALKQ